jgi:hypothetical protein
MSAYDNEMSGSPITAMMRLAAMRNSGADLTMNTQDAPNNVVPFFNAAQQPVMNATPQQATSQYNPAYQPATPQYQQTQAAAQPASQDRDGDGYISDSENTSGYTVLNTSLSENLATTTGGGGNGMNTLIATVWAKYKWPLLGASALAIWWFYLRGDSE